MKNSSIIFKIFLAFSIFLAGQLLISSASYCDSDVGNYTYVLTGSKLSSGFDMGLNTSNEKTNWLINEDGFMSMSYPSGQSWGAVFITVGKPKDPPRPYKNFSAFNTLTVEMKGAHGGEQLEIGIKSNEQPDDGSEKKIQVQLTSEWQPFSFPLNKFNGVDLNKVYVPIEFVFSGPKEQKVYFRNVKYENIHAK